MHSTQQGRDDVVEDFAQLVARPLGGRDGRRRRLHIRARPAEQDARANRQRQCRPRMILHHLYHVQLLLELGERARHPFASQLDVTPDVIRCFSHSLSSFNVSTV